MKNGFRWLFILGLIPLCFGFLGRLNWFFDVFSHFRMYYVIYFLVLGLVALAMKKKWESIVSLSLTILLSLSIVKFYLPVETRLEKEGLKIVSINLLSSNQDYDKVISFLEEGDFDVVFVQELSPLWTRKLQVLETEYPSIKMYPRNDNFGIGVMSKLAFLKIKNRSFSDVGIPSILITVLFNDHEINLLNTHPLPPVGSRYFEIRNQQFRNLNDFVENFEEDIILIGDLNSTNFSPNFNLLLESGKLIDSRKGFGVLSTWHAQWSFISVTLDHVLVTNGIEILDRGVGNDIGSDHLPITVEIDLK